MKHLSHPKYRSDIDGLRAIAVLSVVVFHAFPSLLRGGFIGVDVFFVISGFLISTILFKSLATGQFTFREFYERRIRRIFPALTLVLLSTIVAGWIILFPDEYAQLGKHTLGGAAFVSNFVLWDESGYFDNASNTKPLLHLWSLGIEEQFYLLFPILLWLGHRFKWNLLLLTLGLGSVSLAINFYLGKTYSSADFYSPASRFWELMSGAILAYASILAAPNTQAPLKILSPKIANTLSIFGLVLLIVGLLTIKKQDAFPYWRALIPVIGSVCLIGAGTNTWVNKQILSNRILVWFGLISFPLYLWHWPILVFLRILKGESAPAEYSIAAIFVAIILAWFTYKLIEMPLRFGKHGALKSTFLLLAISGIGACGYFINQRGGLPDRTVAKINYTLSSGQDGGDMGFTTQTFSPDQATDFRKVLGSSRKDTRENPVNILIGDSKAEVLFDGVVRTSQPGARWLMIAGNGTNGSFAPIISDNPAYAWNQESAQKTLELIDALPMIKTVAIASATRVIFKLKTEYTIQDLPESSLYYEALNGMSTFISELTKRNKKVVLVIDNPTLPDPRDCLERVSSSQVLNNLLKLKPNPECQFNLNKHLLLSSLYRQLIEEIAAKYPTHVQVLDTVPLLCNEQAGVCPPRIGNRALYGITDHVSDYGAGIIGTKLNALIARPTSN